MNTHTHAPLCAGHESKRPVAIYRDTHHVVLISVPDLRDELRLSLAKIRTGREINRLQSFLNPQTCYKSRLCSASSGSGLECSFASFIHVKSSSWRTWRSDNSSRF